MTRAERLRIPAQIALSALVAYLLGFWFTSLFPGYLPRIGGLWSALSAIVVTQDSRQDTRASASLRLLGSAFNIPSHGRLAAITVIVVMVTASLDPRLSPLLNALLRFIESCIGTAVAVLEVLLWPSLAALLTGRWPRRGR